MLLFHERVMSCIRTNHVKGMNESCHMYKRVVPHVFTRNWCTRIHMRETFLFHFYISSLRDIEFQEVLLIARIITLVYTCVTDTYSCESLYIECTLFVLSERLLVLFVSRVYMKLRIMSHVRINESCHTYIPEIVAHVCV